MTPPPPDPNWTENLERLEAEVATLRAQQAAHAKSRRMERRVAIGFAAAVALAIGYIKFYEIEDTVTDMVGPPVMDIIEQGKNRADEILESKLIFAHDRVALKFEFGDRTWLARGVPGNGDEPSHILATGQEVTDGFPITYEAFDSDVRIEIIKVPIRKK